jgi:hypothetical protein
MLCSFSTDTITRAHYEEACFVFQKFEISQSKLLYDWRFTANQFASTRSPLRPTTNIFFQMKTCGHNPYVTSSLTREWVCRLQLLLALASAVILRSESHGTHDHILLSQIRDCPQPGGPDPRIYIPQEQGGPVVPPDTGFPFCPLLRLAGLRWRYSTPPPHRELNKRSKIFHVCLAIAKICCHLISSTLC